MQKSTDIYASGDEKKLEEDNDSSNIGSILSSELGSGVEPLAKLIPELEHILPVNRRKSDASASERFDFEALQERVKYAFRVLTRVLSSYFSPLVLILDDLQWTNVSSLDFVDYLMSDTQNSNALMIIGCYRSNEVDENHILFNRIQTLYLVPVT
jgi:predicted ATPase